MAHEDAYCKISQEYHDLNGGHYEVLDQPPSPLEFSRLVHISRPVVVHNYKTQALANWTDEYLQRVLGDRLLSVAVTPNGRADSVCESSEGLEYFVEPHVEKMDVSTLLSAIKSTAPQEEVYYLQSQNGNLYDAPYYSQTDEDPESCEFLTLRNDVPADVPWCGAALGRPPEAVNIWIGSGWSVTSIHNDPYENIYTVVRGCKHFTLLPPSDSWALAEREYPHATWTRDASGQLQLQQSDGVPAVRWSSIIDPTAPHALPREVKPINITLHAGETLYLPVGWWHYVRQGEQAREATIALNWWYDVEMQGMSWVWLSFLRGRIGEAPNSDVEEDE